MSPNIEKLKRRGNIRKLAKILRHNEHDVRHEAARALKELNWSPNNDRDAAHFYVALGNFKKASEFGSVAVEPLIDKFRDLERDKKKDSYWFNRSAIADALGELGDSRAVDVLVSALNENLTGSRAAAALGKIGDPRAAEPLVAALKSEDWIVADALVKIGAPSIPALNRALESNHHVLREQSRSVLERIDDPRAVEALQAAEGRPAPLDDMSEFDLLLEKLRDQDPLKRSEAAQALGDSADPRALEPLLKALSDEEKLVQAMAATSIGMLADQSVLKRLVAALHGEDTTISQLNAVAALTQISDPAVVEPLIWALRVEDREVRRQAARAVVRLYQLENIEDTLKKRILAHREMITGGHQDKWEHAGRWHSGGMGTDLWYPDPDAPCVHTDVSGYIDVDFPL